MKKTSIEIMQQEIPNHSVAKLREDIGKLSYSILTFEKIASPSFEPYKLKLKLLRKEAIILLNKKIVDNIHNDLKKLDKYLKIINNENDMETLVAIKNELINNINAYTYQDGIDKNYSLKDSYVNYQIKGRCLIEMIDMKIKKMNKENKSFVKRIKKHFR